jgi:toxin YoeB
MKLTFTDSAWEDYLWFQEKQAHLLKRLNDLIKDAQRNGFKDIGKPEPLKGDLSGCWSRRINDEHRLVYRIEKDALLIFSCRYHYKK